MSGFSVSRVVAVPPEQAFSWVLPAPLPRVFARGFGPLPKIVGTDQDGEWGTVGQVRTVHTADKSSMREELTTVQPGEKFGYHITEFRGPLQKLAASVEGMWTFEPNAGGTLVTWSWKVVPASGAAKLVMPILAALWRGYGGRALDEVEAGLAQGAAS